MTANSSALASLERSCWEGEFGTLFDGATRTIQQIFTADPKSAELKSGRKESPAKHRDGSPSDTPFGKRQLSWFANAVNESNKASTFALAQAVDSRFQVVEKTVSETHRATEEFKDELSQTKEDLTQTKHEFGG